MRSVPSSEQAVLPPPSHSTAHTVFWLWTRSTRSTCQPPPFSLRTAGITFSAGSSVIFPPHLPLNKPPHSPTASSVNLNHMLPIFHHPCLFACFLIILSTTRVDTRLFFLQCLEHCGKGKGKGPFSV